MHETLKGPGREGHRVPTDTAHANIGEIVVGDAMGSGQHPVGANQRATALGARSTSVQGVEQEGLEGNLSLLGLSAVDDGRCWPGGAL